MKKLVLFLALISFVGFANAQTWTMYTTANGLVSNMIYSVAIDHNGNKWIGTDLGISKFDGNLWTTYNTTNGLISNSINTIEIDSHGNIWVGTISGVSKFDGTNWTNYTTSDGLSHNDVRAIAFDSLGNKWFGTYNGVSKFDDVSWTTYTYLDGLGNNYVTSIAIDSHNNKWFGTHGGGVSKFDGVNWSTFLPSTNGTVNQIQAISVDDQENVWCGTRNNNIAQLLRFNGVVWNSYKIPNNGGYVNDITTDIQGNKWFVSDGGAFKYDNLSWSKYYSAPVNAIAIDVQGNKWLGIPNYGLYKYSDGGAGSLNFACAIHGKIFNDLNGNGVLDNGESGLPGRMVEVVNENNFCISQYDGSFHLYRDTGTYTIKCIPGNYWQLTTDSITTIVVSDSSTQINNTCFGINMIVGINDVSANITGNAARPGFDVKYWLNYMNAGSTTKNGDVTLNKDSLTTFVSSAPPPDAQNGNTITWNYSNLVSLEQRQIQLFLHMPDVSHVGETITETVIINPVVGDTAPTNNYDTLDQVITGSFDPNDKSVNKGSAENGEVLMGEELTYTIRFQNTGTDTAFTVQIRDTINSHMDVASLRIVSASHNLRLDVKGNNIVTFIFDNILLPDSGVNEPASNGFVKFAISPKSGLAENTVVTNKAYIYFDFNPAVVTNEVLNTYIGSILVATEENSAIDRIPIYPNPVANVLTIESPPHSIIEILSIHGQLIKTLAAGGNKTNVGVSALPAGVYIVQVKTEKGMAVRKFVKE